MKSMLLHLKFQPLPGKNKQTQTLKLGEIPLDITYKHFKSYLKHLSKSLDQNFKYFKIYTYMDKWQRLTKSNFQDYLKMVVVNSDLSHLLVREVEKDKMRQKMVYEMDCDQDSEDQGGQNRKSENQEDVQDVRSEFKYRIGSKKKYVNPEKRIPCVDQKEKSSFRSELSSVPSKTNIFDSSPLDSIRDLMKAIDFPTFKEPIKRLGVIKDSNERSL